MPISAVLIPHDNFSERSTTHFGVGELIDLSITNPAHTTAASLGGLRWFISKGGGTLAGAGNNGQALFTAPPSAGSVTLVLKVVSGGDSGKIVASTTITIIEPQGAKMVQQPGTGILHVNDTWSCAFIGDVYLLPASVSFANVMIREASVPAAAGGFLDATERTIARVGPSLQHRPRQQCYRVQGEHGWRQGEYRRFRAAILRRRFSVGHTLGIHGGRLRAPSVHQDSTPLHG